MKTVVVTPEMEAESALIWASIDADEARENQERAAKRAKRDQRVLREVAA